MQDLTEKTDRSLAALAGFFLMLVLFKFGTPVVLVHTVTSPANLSQIIEYTWPLNWGYLMLIAFALALARHFETHTLAPRWIILLPVAWLGWQFVATLGAAPASKPLLHATLPHFCACAGCFYLGWGVLGRLRHPAWMGLGLATGLFAALAIGVQLHQNLTYLHQQVERLESKGPAAIEPALLETFVKQGTVTLRGDHALVNPEFKRRLERGRAQSLYGSPNSFAGAILLTLPVSLFVLFHAGRHWRPPWFWLPPTGLAALGVLCLFWSGSKAGWLVALVLLGVVLLNLEWPRRWKLGVTAAVLVCGLAAFAFKYQDYFARGATSLGARFDYWRAAGATAQAHPFMGTGPGTFQVAYASYRKKHPQRKMEPTKLAHNDYLQQASDSGLPGFALYTTFILGSLVLLWRKTRGDPLGFAVWLGVLAWAVQGVVDYGLYVPALAWPAFLGIGWLWGRPNLVDTPADCQQDDSA